MNDLIIITFFGTWVSINTFLLTISLNSFNVLNILIALFNIISCSYFVYDWSHHNKTIIKEKQQ